MMAVFHRPSNALVLLLTSAFVISAEIVAFHIPFTQRCANKYSPHFSDHKKLGPLINSPLFMSTTTSKNENYEESITNAKIILNRCVETKDEEPGLVLDALEDLEKLMRQKSRAEPETAPKELLSNLNGDWRLVFTTGTQETQKKWGRKINYFPIKAVQSFNTETEPMEIQNGIYFGDLAVLKFYGDFEFDLDKRKVEFDFDQIAVLGFKIDLGKGKAAELGAASGLGSDKNTKLIAKNKKPFFNWISADDTIATARGGGGGIALWKRIKLAP